MNDPKGFPGFSVGRRRLLTYAVSSPVMPIVAGFGVNLATPSSAVAATPQIQWSAGMETTPDHLSEWSEQVNDQNCWTEAILASQAEGGIRPPKGGLWQMKQTVNSPA